MSEKIEIFINKFKQNFQKKHFLMMAIAVLFIAVSVSVPIHQAQAGLVDIGADFLIRGFEAILDSGVVQILGRLVLAVVFFVLNLGLDLSIILVRFGAWLIDVMLDPRLYVGVPNPDPTLNVPGVLTSSTITVGWTTVRDMCNTFYVFFLLIIAFGTILRSSTYNAKNLLPKLIISLFLINFSAEITKLVIDFGQVFMYGIMSWMGTFGGGGETLTSIVYTFKNEVNGAGLLPSLDQVIRVAFALAYSVVLGLTYIMLALFLLVRIVAFVFLIILSPIAFLSIVMPSMGKYTSEWWGELVKYSIFGPIFMFFVYLSATMANELVTNFTPLAATGDLEKITGILYVMVPHSVALIMLLAVVPITQRLGVGGANKIIGGTVGMGKIAMGTYAGIKLAGGLGKKAVEAPASRIHAYGMGKGGAYKEKVDALTGKLKTSPITGRIFLKHESAKADKHKEEVAKHEKVMDNLTASDKKAYVDSFQLDRKGKADATQAMFNLLAKDSGKGLTDTRLQKMGYEKGGVFDKEAFIADYNRTKAYGHDTENLETYRPDLIEVKGDPIKTKKDKEDKVAKIVHDGKEKSIKLSALEDNDIANKLEELLGKKKYDNLVNNKSQEERDELAEHKESNLARRIKLQTTNPTHPEALNITTPTGKAELMKSQEEIATLIKPTLKEGKMHDITGVDASGNVVYSPSPNVNIELTQNVINKMTKDQLLDLDTSFLKNYGHMIADTNIEHIAKFGETEQLEAMKKAVDDALLGIRVQIPTRLTGVSGTGTMTTRRDKIKKKLA